MVENLHVVALMETCINDTRKSSLNKKEGYTLKNHVSSFALKVKQAVLAVLTAVRHI